MKNPSFKGCFYRVVIISFEAFWESEADSGMRHVVRVDQA